MVTYTDFIQTLPENGRYTVANTINYKGITLHAVYACDTFRGVIGLADDANPALILISRADLLDLVNPIRLGGLLHSFRAVCAENDIGLTADLKTILTLKAALRENSAKLYSSREW